MTTIDLGSLAAGASVALTGSLISSENSFSPQLRIAILSGTLTTLGCTYAAKNLSPDSKIMRVAQWIKPIVITYAGVTAIGAGLRTVAFNSHEAPEVGIGILAALVVAIGKTFATVVQAVKTRG